MSTGPDSAAGAADAFRLPQFSLAGRSLDLALVTDGAPSMLVWDDTFDEVVRVLRQGGAFRAVERWRLLANGGVSSAAAPGKVHPAGRLTDPSGRRVVLVATSATTQAWYAPGPWAAVAAWAAVMPTALVQVLPRQYWPGTAVGEPYLTVRAGRPAAPNSACETRLAWWADDPGGVPLPVTALDRDGLESWAKAALTGTAWAPGITATPPDPQQAPPGAAQSAVALVNDFLSKASPGAERLARILATADGTLSVPAIAVLQERLAPETGVREAAEVLSAGLLTAGEGPGEPRFRFRDDVRRLLRRGVTTFEEWDTRDALGNLGDLAGGHERYLAVRDRVRRDSPVPRHRQHAAAPGAAPARSRHR